MSAQQQPNKRRFVLLFLLFLQNANFLEGQTLIQYNHRQHSMNFLSLDLRNLNVFSQMSVSSTYSSKRITPTSSRASKQMNEKEENNWKPRPQGAA